MCINIDKNANRTRGFESMLGQRRRRWINIKTQLRECLVFAILCISADIDLVPCGMLLARLHYMIRIIRMLIGPILGKIYGMSPTFYH